MKERPQPKVSIIIPLWIKFGHDGRYGNCETLVVATECIKRLVEVTPKELYELILIDNGCDNVALYNYNTQELFSHANVLIKVPENLGFAPAMNMGFGIARGEYICNMNSDILVFEGWLETMLKDIQLPFHPPCGLLMPALVKERVRFPENLKVKKDEVGMPNKGKFGENAEFGSMWLAPREVIDKVRQENGGYQFFRECFLYGFQEDRLCYVQVRKLGYSTQRDHNLRVWHIGNVTMSKVPDRKKYTDANRELCQKIKKEEFGIDI